MCLVCFLKQDSTIIAQASPKLVNLLSGLYVLRRQVGDTRPG